MPDTLLDLSRRSLAPSLADIVREARMLVGWTQRDLAARARTSQATIWRFETGRAEHLDLAVVERVLAALGIRGSLGLDARHLADRRRQRDGVHARLNGYVARRLGRHGWLTSTEVLLGDRVPRGWIDVLAFRPADRALIVEETKADLPDMGALQRSLAFYEREAWAAARRLGWNAGATRVLVVTLDTAAIARRLADNRDLVKRVFPEPIDRFAAWIADSSGVEPRGWGLGQADPASRGERWLRPTSIGSRRRPPAYRDYADAAAHLLRS